MSKYAEAAAAVFVAGYVSVAIVRGNGAALVSALAEERPFLTALAAWAVIGAARDYVPVEAQGVLDAVRNLAILAVFIRAASSGELQGAIDRISTVFGSSEEGQTQ